MAATSSTGTESFLMAMPTRLSDRTHITDRCLVDQLG